MQISPQNNQFLHSKLPIEADENILGVYRHHWFAYASIWLIGLTMAVVIMILAVIFTVVGGDGIAADRKVQILAAAGALSVLIVLGTFVPVYLRMQEQVVLTEESLLQILQPSLFASQINQVSLQHITDVAVQKDFFGTLFNYGHITIETPGEQDNYEFFALADPQNAAQEIIHAHENFNAALEGGHMPTTLGKRPTPQASVPIDPQQYQQFLAYQQMLAKQQQDQAAQANNPANNPTDDQTNDQGQQAPPKPPKENS